MNANPTSADQALAQMTRDAHQYLSLGDHEKFLQLMERAAAMHPLKFEIAIDIAISFLQRYDYPSAEQWFESIVSSTSHPSQALEFIAFQWRNHNRFDMAERWLERACALPDATAKAFTQLGEMYERTRQMDKAIQCAARALSMDGENPKALLLRARLERSANDLEAGEKTLRRFLFRTDSDSQSARVRGWYEMGANLDRQGRYEEAMSAFVSAKELMLPRWGASANGYLQMRKDDYRASQALLEEMVKPGSESAAFTTVPHSLALICGHPRSGTTLLEQILDSHPHTISAEETSIFHDTSMKLAEALGADKTRPVPFERATPAALQAARDWYLNSMQKFLGEPVGDRLLIDKNPGLTSRIPQLLRLFPRARVIVAIRDPRDVCLSCFMQPLPMNPVSCSYLTLADTVDEYCALMDFWLRIKPLLKDQALEVRYEDVVAGLEPVARQVLEFLDLRWDPQVLQFNQHASQKLIRSPSYAAVAQPISKSRAGHWKNYKKYLQPVMEKLAPLVEAFGFSA